MVAWGSTLVIIVGASLLGMALALPTVEMMLALLAAGALALIALPIAVFRAYRKPDGMGPLSARVLLAAVLATVLSVVVVVVAGWPLRRLAFVRAADRAQPIVDAIGAYESTTGNPPAMLTDLVPDHLATVPGTGLIAYRIFEYERFEQKRRSLLWWDLGSRKGVAMRGLWIYPDGDPDHAILVLVVDHEDQIVDAIADRMPSEGEERSFDAELWHSQPDERLRIVRDLPNAHPIRRMSRSAAETLLGAPTGERVLRDTPWELRIPCSDGFLNWDVFFYWPTERYPDRAYGGWIEPIGRWAYVHE